MLGISFLLARAALAPVLMCKLLFEHRTAATCRATSTAARTAAAVLRWRHFHKSITKKTVQTKTLLFALQDGGYTPGDQHMEASQNGSSSASLAASTADRAHISAAASYDEKVPPLANGGVFSPSLQGVTSEASLNSLATQSLGLTSQTPLLKVPHVAGHVLRTLDDGVIKV